MMMYAYNKLYLYDAMEHMGEMLEYVVYDLKLDLSSFWEMFCSSEVCRQFELGFPKYNAGMSGVELAREVIHEVTGQQIDTNYSAGPDCSPEYWAGWILARYQWEKNISFKRLSQLGLSATEVLGMYILHEADERKFVELADGIINERESLEENRLKRLRKYAHMTQKMLSERSGVSLRMIQLYEQGQNDLSKAQVTVVLNLAQALGCQVRDLIE